MTVDITEAFQTHLTKEAVVKYPSDIGYKTIVIFTIDLGIK